MLTKLGILNNAYCKINSKNSKPHRRHSYAERVSTVINTYKAVNGTLSEDSATKKLKVQVLSMPGILDSTCHRNKSTDR